MLAFVLLPAEDEQILLVHQLVTRHFRVELINDKADCLFNSEMDRQLDLKWVRSVLSLDTKGHDHSDIRDLCRPIMSLHPLVVGSMHTIVHISGSVLDSCLRCRLLLVIIALFLIFIAGAV